jgi:hypothetical protein
LRKAEAEKDDTRDRPGREPKEAESEEAEAEAVEEEAYGENEDPSPCPPRDDSGSEGSKDSVVEGEGSKNPIRLCDGEGCTAAFPSLSSSLSLLSVFLAEVCREFTSTATAVVLEARRCRSERILRKAV